MCATDWNPAANASCAASARSTHSQPTASRTSYVPSPSAPQPRLIRQSMQLQICARGSEKAAAASQREVQPRGTWGSARWQRSAASRSRRIASTDNCHTAGRVATGKRSCGHVTQRANAQRQRAHHQDRRCVERMRHCWHAGESGSSFQSFARGGVCEEGVAGQNTGGAHHLGIHKRRVPALEPASAINHPHTHTPAASHVSGTQRSLVLVRVRFQRAVDHIAVCGWLRAPFHGEPAHEHRVNDEQNTTTKQTTS